MTQLPEKITIDQVTELLIPQLEKLDLKKEEIDINSSLLEQGILDSISFLEFIVDLEEKFNKDLDFSNINPSEFSSIRKINEMLNNGNKDT